MSQELPLAVQHEETKLKLSSYIAGFGLSLLFTLASYLLVINHAATKGTLIILVVAFAFCQFIVQLLLFLHLGQETKPRWKLGVFFFMLGVVVILVFGSLWIMHNLSNRMLSLPQELRYNQSQDNL
ncbi:MAG: cytochrome o ubiquinol oxidase subunit IV [Candidatus Saccharimonadales bacterium]